EARPVIAGVDDPGVLGDHLAVRADHVVVAPVADDETGPQARARPTAPGLAQGFHFLRMSLSCGSSARSAPSGACFFFTMSWIAVAHSPSISPLPRTCKSGCPWAMAVVSLT